MAVTATRSGCSAAGFTLVEMMIAMFILTISILGLTAAVVTSMQVNQGNDLRNAASRLASEKAEELLAVSPNQLTSGSDTPSITLRGAGTLQVSRTWNVEDVANVSTMKEVTITVSYSDDGVSRTTSMLLYREDGA